MLKARTKFLAAVLALFIALTASALLYLRTDSFQEFVRKTLVSRIESSTGLHCSVARLALDIYRGTLHIGGLELTAPEEGTGFLSLSIDEIRAKFNISSLWHFRMRLAELEIKHPQVVLSTGENKKKEGSSWNPEQFLKTLKISMQLETERFTVTDGTIKINENTSPFNLSLKDLDCRIGYREDAPGYRIFLAYKESRLYYKHRDIVHDLKIDAELSLQGIKIDTLEFRHGESRLHGSGSVASWDSPELVLNLSGEVTSKDLVLADESLNEGNGNVDVRIEVRYGSDGIRLKGDFLARTGSYRKMDYADMSGDLEILHDVLYLRNVKGKIAQGNFTADGEIQLKESNNKPHRMSIHAEKVPLVEVGDLLNTDLIRFRNVVDSETLITWGFGRHTHIDCSATLYGAEKAAGDDLKSTPLGGKVQFTYYGGGLLDLSSVNLHSAATDLVAHGGKEDLYHIQLSSSRLFEPFNLLMDFSPGVSRLIARYPDLATIAGKYEISGDARIRSSSEVEFEGRIRARDGRWQSIQADTMAAAVSFKESVLEFRNLAMQRGDQSVRGNLTLNFSGEENVGGFAYRGDFQKVDLALLKDFDLLPLDMGGALSGSASIRFEKNAWVCDGQVSVGKGNISGEPFDRLDAHIAVADRSIRFRDIRIRRGKASVGADGSIDLDGGLLDFTARLDRLPLEDLPGAGEKDFPLRGYANASGSISGTWASPEVKGDFDLADLFYDSWNLGHGEGNLELKENVLQGSLDISPDYGELSLQARISIAEGYPGNVTLDLRKFNIQKMISGRTIPFVNIDRTELNGTVTGEGSFADLENVEFKGKMDGVLFGINDYELKNSGEIEFSILHRKLHFDTARIVGQDTDLSLNGDLPLDGGDLDLNLGGNLNLKILSGMQEKVSTSGNADIDIHATGSKEDPEIVGRLTLVNGGLAYADFPFPVSELEGDVLFSKNVIRLENISGKAASGSIKVSGAYEHQKMVMQSINMAVTIENARLPYPKDFDSVVNATLTLSGDRDLQLLAGDVEVVRSEYMRGFNLLERFASQGGASSGTLATEPMLENLRLNIEFHSNDGLIIDNDLAKVRGSLRLTLRGTPAYPILTGRVEAVDGTIFFRRNRFEISHAYADFVDRNRINPILEIRAEADVKTYRLILDATGTLDNLSVNIRSDPPMSTVDIISLLTSGMAQTGTQTTERESQMAGMSAASVLSENLTGVIGKRVERILGLESFRVDPFLTGTNNDPTARITISERISRDLVLTFSRNLSTNEEQVVVIEYDIGKGLSVTATRDENGQYGIDFRLRKRFR